MQKTKVAIKLEIFKTSGKYYTSGEYQTEKNIEHAWEIFDEVRQMQEENRLPGLAEGADQSKYIVHVHIDNPLGYPGLIVQREKRCPVCNDPISQDTEYCSTSCYILDLDAAGRPVETLLLIAANILREYGGGPVEDALRILASRIVALKEK